MIKNSQNLRNVQKQDHRRGNCSWVLVQDKFIATNPLNHEQKVPTYFANFVLMDYGFGAVFGCPVHDQRDFDLQKNMVYKLIPSFDLKIKMKTLK